jgi:hypothetical protein
MVVVGLVGLGFPLNTFDFNEERKLWECSRVEIYKGEINKDGGR